MESNSIKEHCTTCKRGFRALFDLVICPSLTCKRSKVYCRECFGKGYNSDADSDQNLHDRECEETNKLQFQEVEGTEEMDSMSFYPLLKVLVDAPPLQQKEDHRSFQPKKQSRDEGATTDTKHVLVDSSRRNANVSDLCHDQNSDESSRKVCFASQNPPRTSAIRRVSSFSDSEQDNQNSAGMNKEGQMKDRIEIIRAIEGEIATIDKQIYELERSSSFKRRRKAFDDTENSCDLE